MCWLALKALFGLGIVTLAALGAGGWIAPLLPSSCRRFERVTFAALGGFGVLSSVLFLLGQRIFTPLSIVLTLAVFCALAAIWFRTIFPARSAVRSARPKIPKLPAVIVVCFLVFTAIGGLAEMTGDWNNDAIAYHLLGPKVWLRHGVIRPVLENSLTAFPQIPETLFAAVQVVGGDRAPNFSSFLTLGLLLAVVASLAVRCGLGDAHAWWAAAIVAMMPAVYAGGHGCFVDAIFAAFVLAAVRIGLGARSVREWVLFGVFCGFALGTKYTGLLAVSVLLPCALLLSRKREREPLLALTGKAALAMAIACLLASPYYIRNWLLLGCPIYPPPPGYALFCSPKYLSSAAISQFHEYIRQRGIGLGRGFFAFLLLPFNLTYHTSRFNGAGGIGLCPLALAPIGMVRRRANDFARMLMLGMLLLVVAWFFTEQESRFLIDVYVLGAVFSVVGWHAVLENGRKLGRYLAAAVILISCAYGAFRIGNASMGDVRSVFSPAYATFRRQVSIPYLPSFEYLNSQPSVRGILILDRSVTPYYLNKNYVKPVGDWGERTLPGSPDSSQALAQALDHRLPVSHVLDVVSEVSPFQIKPGTPGLTLVFEANHQRIYRIE